MWNMTFEKSLKAFPTDKPRFQLISTNASSGQPSTLKLSTVFIDVTGSYKYYESCLFGDKDSEVLDTYVTLSEAVVGHNKLAAQLGLK